VIAADTKPKLARGVRLHQDTVRGGWSLLAPERVLTANPVAVEVLKLCDGSRTFAGIVDALSAKFSAERSRIEADAAALLGDLCAKRMVEL
jgi:pyrroloquinoline quinone biosynthesis protein D